MRSLEELTQRLPLRLRVLAQERTEAAACGGRGAVDEDEKWLVDVEAFEAHWRDSVRQGLARGVLPRVEAGAGLEAALDDVDEDLGGKPGRKLHRKIDAEVARQLCQVGELDRALAPGSRARPRSCLSSIAGRAACLSTHSLMPRSATRGSVSTLTASPTFASGLSSRTSS